MYILIYGETGGKSFIADLIGRFHVNNSGNLTPWVTVDKIINVQDLLDRLDHINAYSSIIFITDQDNIEEFKNVVYFDQIIKIEKGYVKNLDDSK